MFFGFIIFEFYFLWRMLQLPKYLMKTDTFLNWSIRNYYFLSLCLESSDWIWVKILSKFNILSSISYFIFSSYFFYKLWLEKNIFIGAWGSTRKGKRTYIITLFWLSVVQNNFVCILLLQNEAGPRCDSVTISDICVALDKTRCQDNALLSLLSSSLSLLFWIFCSQSAAWLICKR